MLKRFRSEQEGLTLIELIVVVAIIGVLAWLITPRVLDALNTSKLQSALSVSTEIQSGLERWATENDASYPETLPDGTTAITTWNHLMTVLGEHITVATNDTSNLELGTPIGSAAIDYTFDNAASPPEVCFVVRARDRDKTWIQVQATGVTTSIGATAPAC